MKNNNLEVYNKKRNFSNTSEPFGKKEKKKTKKLKFVIQHHIARKDHYDLRLEWDGVYKSFAVPKGPSYNPSDKRLAILVEDHPLSYGNFEGTIPKGNYGAGTVMVFDKGTWEVEKNPDFKKGPIKFFLKGKRFIGGWSLIKLKDDNWLLIKEKDKYVKNFDIKEFKTSIKSNKTMDTIAKKNKKQKIEITSPEKIIIKKGNITKIDIVNYYKSVKNKIMPFLDKRLISTIRCPNGNEKFFMKHLNTDSKNLGRKKIKDKEGTYSDYYYIKNTFGLIEEVQMNSYEFHIWSSNINNINHPDIIVFDLDPDELLPLKKLRDGIKDLKNILDELKLKSFLKTSGGKGYHVYVPLYTSSFDKAEQIAKNIALIMVNKWPDKYTINMRKKMRKNKIFIDYYRNKFGATSVCPYSIRLKNNGPISCPISWNELDSIKPNQITIKNYKERIRKNPWKNFFSN